MSFIDRSHYENGSWSTSYLRSVPRGATPHHLTPDVWAQMEGNGSFLDQEGGKRSTAIWMYFEGLHQYGCVSRELIPIWVCFQRTYTDMSP